MAPHGRRMEGRERGDHHGRTPPLPDAGGRRTPGSGHQRQRFVHQVEVRQPLRLPRVAGRRHQARHGRDDRRQGGRRVRLRRRGQGLRPLDALLRRPGDRHGNRPHLRLAGRHGGLRGEDRREYARRGQHLCHLHGQLRHHHAGAHGADARPGHRLQHRPFRQRNPDGAPRNVRAP